MYLVISTSLNPDSRSRILARTAKSALERNSVDSQFLDLAELNLPVCDGASCYGHPDSASVIEAVSSAKGILLAAPIYNYDVSAAAKNLIEITGKAWTEKIVGFLCAAGGQGSFMAPMSVANSLMLDFRSLILPRFVYASGEAFAGNLISEADVDQRIEQLVDQLILVTEAIHGPKVKS